MSQPIIKLGLLLSTSPDLQTYVIGGVLAVLGFLSIYWFNDFAKNLKDIVKVLNEIKILLATQEKDIEFIKERLNNHSDRLHELEKNK